MFSEKQVEIYPTLIGFYHQVVNSRSSDGTTDERLANLDSAALKILMHAATVNYLRAGTRISLNEFPDGNIADFPSVFAIVRSALDTYLNMFEIYFDSITQDEYDYRYKVHWVNAFRLREQILDIVSPFATSDHIKASLEELAKVRDEITKTRHYASLAQGQQETSLNGNVRPKREWHERAVVAGIGARMANQLYAYLSAYTHGNIFGISQSTAVKDDEEKKAYIRAGIVAMMLILSLIILNYARKFPAAQAVCDANPELHKYVQDFLAANA